MVFVTGPKSLFYDTQLGGYLPTYLEAHGYKVLSPNLAFRSDIRKVQLKNWLQLQTEPNYHFFITHQTLNELSHVLSNFTESSYTFLENYSDKKTSLNYKIHKNLVKLIGLTADPYFQSNWSEQNTALYNQILDRCVELAENDYICET